MAEQDTRKDSPVWMTGEFATSDVVFRRAIVREKFNMLTETTIEFKSGNKSLDLDKLLGRPMSVRMEKADQSERRFSGICVSVENLGLKDGESQYVAHLRPWLWMLTRASDNRIFQEMDAVAIIEQVFADHGFTDFDKRLSETRKVRDYCVQYRETDYDFVCRLMEEEGIYFFFTTEGVAGDKEKMILCDGRGAHRAVPGEKVIEYYGRGAAGSRRPDSIGEWSGARRVTFGKMTLNDFDPLAPSADLKTMQTIKTGTHSHNQYERYHYQGHYRKDTDLGNTRGRVRMEAEAVRYETKRGAGSVRNLAVGAFFSMDKHPDHKKSEEFILSEATHYIQETGNFDDTKRRRDLEEGEMQFPEDMAGDMYAITFACFPKATQFRAPLITPWPEIAGLQTAIVVGKSGEEIWTDEHGRIKVQFHWDRDGKKNENSSCWVRVATPWSGKGWGMVAIPRMGQEVVIQFEEGNPDRPICTGMLWNEETKPAFNYPDDATQLGIRTRSSKSGSDQTYNELMFDDKKDAELMRVQAQKDHQELIKNKSVRTIGFDEIDAGAHDADGCLSEVIKQDVTRTITDGNHYHTIKKGDEEFKIETGSQTIEIETDKTQTIKQNYSTTISQGNHTTEVKQGNQTDTVKLGNISVKASAGKITMEAAQKIELKVGGSKIEITPASITIKSVMVKIDASAMAEVKSGAMTQIKGSAMVIVKGGMTMIN
ncbi:MAG: type VI secretion system tip protein VgrG [Pseudooceanicola sp.]|nr:type VI secretion system tip protein VgrG [Pseudooceanicola sp.]